jgi:hypothetical protein
MLSESSLVGIPVQGNDIVLPDEVVHRINTLIDMLRSSRFTKLTNQDVTEGSQMSCKLFGTNPLKDFVGHVCDLIRV